MLLILIGIVRAERVKKVLARISPAAYMYVAVEMYVYLLIAYEPLRIATLCGR